MISSILRFKAEVDPCILVKYPSSTILTDNTFESTLAIHLVKKLSITSLLPIAELYNLFLDVFTQNPQLCIAQLQGFPRLPSTPRDAFLAVSGSILGRSGRVFELFAVDIHSDCGGCVFWPWTGIVIGETTVIGNNVTVLLNVTVPFGCNI